MIILLIRLIEKIKKFGISDIVIVYILFIYKNIVLKILFIKNIIKNQYGKLKIKSKNLYDITIDLKLNSLKKEMSPEFFFLEIEKEIQFQFFKKHAKNLKIKYTNIIQNRYRFSRQNIII